MTVLFCPSLAKAQKPILGSEGDLIGNSRNQGLTVGMDHGPIEAFSPEKMKRLQISLRMLLGLIACLALSLGIAKYYAAQQTEVKSKIVMRRLSIIMWALFDYGQSHGRFPSDCCNPSNSENSWRFQLVPYLESGDWSALDFNAVWKSHRNSSMASIAHPDFCLPDVASGRGRQTATRVMAIVGPGTFFSEAVSGRVHREPDAIVLMEVFQSDVHWMEPGDIDPSQLSGRLAAKPRIVGNLPGRVHVAFSDRTIWCLRSDLPIHELAKFFTIDDAARHEREHVLSAYRIDERLP